MLESFRLYLSLRSHAPTSLDGFTSVRIWYHSCKPSYLLPLVNSDAYPSNSSRKSEVRMFHMLTPSIACLNFVGLLTASNSASSISFISTILKHFKVVVPYFDPEQTLSAWVLAYSHVKVLLSNRYIIPSFVRLAGSPASHSVGNLSIPIIRSVLKVLPINFMDFDYLSFVPSNLSFFSNPFFAFP